MQPIHLFFNNVTFPLRNRKKLKEFIEFIFEDRGFKLDSLNYIFCSDNDLLTINQQFLKHDDYTDIITFDLSKDSNSITGEIYISIDRVKENAKTHREKFEKEIHRVMFHGALHLTGQKDKTPQESIKMRTLEEHYLQLYLK